MRTAAAWLLLAAGLAQAAGHDRGEELGQVRAHLQGGEYRAALALAAHVADEHRDAETVTLYARLLEAGGHAEHAQRLLAGLPAPPAPPAPAVSGTAVAPSARVIGNAVLVQARQAVMPTPAGQWRRLWLRNGLGQTVTATPVGEAGGLTTLALDAALPWDPRSAPAARAPFAGSPGFVIAHAPAASGTATWPRLYAGFLGPAPQLLIEAPASASGAPLIDATGRLAGITLPAADGPLRWQPLPAAPAASAAAARITSDEAYERGLRLALQVIATE